jgi:hypothetical protein
VPTPGFHGMTAMNISVLLQSYQYVRLMQAFAAEQL